ncbi:unnamed protein product [Eruca vesicaria subsp. sativa]|uniref:Uncharacterized protein n=1 Tax=Eruca vesicaria subsp. sativa TaxID=29727 RepID=A0ABC8LWD9_ERUVS|nr:unnamed protein product [Eruca vesicaria subsp. sativa]
MRRWVFVGGVEDKMISISIADVETLYPVKMFKKQKKKETYYTFNRINERYGSPGYEPVVLVDRHVPRFE